jgi:hypothetical protein
MPEICGLGLPRMLVDELGVSGDDQQGRQMRWDDVYLSRPETTQIELVEVPRVRQRLEPNP